MKLLDAVGLEGPRAILALKGCLREIPGGGMVELWVDRHVALEDVPNFCASYRHRLLMVREQQGHLVMLLQKRQTQAA